MKSFQLALLTTLVGFALNGCSSGSSATFGKPTEPPRAVSSAPIDPTVDTTPGPVTEEPPSSEIAREPSSEPTALQALSIEGVWSGDVGEFGVGPYSIRVSFSAGMDEMEAAVEYPELGCGGFWTMDDVSRNVYSFTESLTFGKGSCIDQAQIRIAVTDPNEMTYEVLPPYRATSTLIREPE